MSSVVLVCQLVLSNLPVLIRHPRTRPLQRIVECPDRLDVECGTLCGDKSMGGSALPRVGLSVQVSAAVLREFRV